ncbi:MAG: DegV family protein [Dehalococcoidia bacterium]
MPVRIVTDSTCDLPRAVVDSLAIAVVPLTVFFGDEALLDGIDIDGDTFYERLAASPVLPRTSQPSTGAFRTAYERVAQETDEIVSVHLSSRLSGTFNSASLARQELLGKARIELIDSYQVSLGLGAIVLDAAQAAQAGATMQEVIDVARRAMDRVHVVAAVDTLEYLQKGGRIGRARSMLGSILSIKPLVHVEDGEVAPFDRVRTRRKVWERMIEVATADRSIRRLFVACTGNDAEAERFIEEVRPLLPHTDIRLGRLGPVVGVYTGPNTLGVCTVAKG